MKTTPAFLHSIEPLEARIAPAVAIIPFTDSHGDLCTVKLTTKEELTPAELNAVATFVASGAGQQLEKLDLTNAKFQCAKVEIDAIPDPTKPAAEQGDGFVNVGHIDATGRDLQKVKVDGDLGQVDAGDADTKTPAIKESMKVQSMGLFGVATQGVGGSLISTFMGKVKKLEVCGDLKEAEIQIQGGADGKLDTGMIGGSLIGGTAFGSGKISTTGDAGTVTVGGDVVGGAGNFSGSVDIGGKAGTVTVGGSVKGDAGINSGSVSAGSVKTGITVNGNVEGGSGPSSGKINSSGATGKVKVGGSVKGGSGNGSGTVAMLGPTPKVEIAWDVLGGTGPGSGGIFAASRLDTLMVGGNVIGGTQTNAGVLFAGGDIAKVSIGGGLFGGMGDFSGGLISGGTIGSAIIWGDIVGGSVSGTDSLSHSGFVDANRITNFMLKGSIIAGENTGNGTLAQSGSVAVNRDFGNVTIMGSTVGNDSNPVVLSGAFSDNNEIIFKSIKIGGSVIETNILAGYDTLGRPVNADAQIGPVTVGRDWLASNLVAGIFAGTDGLFGTPDDKAINPVDNPGSFNNSATFSTIGMVKIGCQAQGDPGLVIGQYGIVASKIAKIVTAGRTYSFTAAPADDVFRLGSTGGAVGDFFAREVAA